jgi:hypothetical protein
VVEILKKLIMSSKLFSWIEDFTQFQKKESILVKKLNNLAVFVKKSIFSIDQILGFFKYLLIILILIKI